MVGVGNEKAVDFTGFGYDFAAVRPNQCHTDMAMYEVRITSAKNLSRELATSFLPPGCEVANIAPPWRAL